MRKYILIFFVFAACYTVRAQEDLILHKQYLLNDFAINPAIAGSKPYNPFNLGYRKQWMGSINQAPVFQSISLHGLLFGYRVGIGGGVYNNITGPTSLLGGHFAYSYSFPFIKNKSKLSIGASGSVTQFAVDEKKLKLDQPNDQVLMGGVGRSYIGDAAFGIYYYPDKYSKDEYFISFSALNLLQNRIDYKHWSNLPVMPKPRKYFLWGGYTFSFSDNLVKIEPSLLARLEEVPGLKYGADINTRIILKDIFWVGGSFRTGDAIVAMAGIGTRSLKIAYAYDRDLSAIKKYSLGSHELSIAIYFQRRDIKKF